MGNLLDTSIVRFLVILSRVVCALLPVILEDLNLDLDLDLAELDLEEAGDSLMRKGLFISSNVS